MNILNVMFLVLLIYKVGVRADIGKFLKSFVENERIPTMLVFNGICWKNYVKVRLMKELSRAGIRSCASVPQSTSLQDNALLFLADLDCPRTAEVFENATIQGFQRLPYRWLALASTPINAESKIWNPFLVDSDLVVAAAEGQGYRMTELHKPAANWTTILTPRGGFHGVLTDTRPHRELFRRRCNLLGAPLIMSNGIQDSNTSQYHLLQEDSLELQHDLISKNSWTLGKLGFLMLNATPIAIFSYRFGFLQNGQWSGIIKDMMDYKADTGTNIGMTLPRLKVATYIDNLDNSRIRFVLRQPSLSLTANIFSLPFSSGVWIATVISFFIAGLAYCLIQKLTGGMRERQDGLAGEAFLLAMGALSQQGCEIQPRNVSTRIVFWVLFTSLMALYAAYSAYIVVLLQAPSSSINNLAQLSKSKVTLAALDVDYNNFLFKAGTDPVRKEISRKIIREKGAKPFYNLTEGVARIRKGLFAFHSLVEPVYREIEKTFQETEKCDLVEIDYIGYSGLYAPASRQSPYLELLRVAFKRLREVGLKSAVNFRYEARKPSCKESVAMFSSVGLIELQPVLLLMSYGVALSVAVAVMEQLVFHANRYRLRQGRLAERLFARRN